MAGQLILRFQRGDAVFELQGDADAVQAAFTKLKQELAQFFGPGVSPAGSLGLFPVSASGQPSNAPGPAPLLTNPAGSFRLVVDSLNLPGLQAGERFADDVNGDGRPDNQFAQIIAALESQAIDLQKGIDAEMNADKLIVLLTLATELATPAADQRAAVALLAGKPLQRSTRMYVADASVPPVTVHGRIVGGRFESDDPRSGGTLVKRDIEIPFGPGVTAALTVQGLRVSFDVARDGRTISGGQITGSVKQADVQNQLVPALAAMMNQWIQSAPNSTAAKNVLKLFDTGGSTSPTGAATQAGDGVIDVSELATNKLLMSLLQPDVQIFDSQGNYAPNPLGGNADSMSFGLGFSATAASY